MFICSLVALGLRLVEAHLSAVEWGEEGKLVNYGWQEGSFLRSAKLGDLIHPAILVLGSPPLAHILSAWIDRH